MVFWISNPRSTFGQIWAEKVKAVCFAWKLAHTHTHAQYLEDVDISFLKFQILRMLIFFSEISFLKFQTFWAQICPKTDFGVEISKI